MVYTGVIDEKKIKEGWKKYEMVSPELFVYIKTFYWTLLNYFDGCRVVSSGNVMENTSATKTKDVKSVETVVDFARKLFSFIPAVSGVVNLMTDAFKAVI